MAAGSSLCLVIFIFCRVLVGHFDPGGLGSNPYHSWAVPSFLGPCRYSRGTRHTGGRSGWLGEPEALARAAASSAGTRRAHTLDGLFDPVPTAPTCTDLRAGRSR